MTDTRRTTTTTTVPHAPTGPEPAPGESRPVPPVRHQRAALVVLLTASFTLAVDFSILTVALPAIGTDVGFTVSNLQWIATAFALCAAGFTLLFGRAADLFGRRRLFLVGIAVLGVSSLIGGLAQDPEVLLAARVAQGLATAVITPSALSLLTTTFAEGPLRDRALGLNGALMAAGFTTGAVLGGVLTELLSWRWAFFINVAIALAVLIIAPMVLSDSRPQVRPRLDVPGAVTVTAGLLAVVYGLTQAAERSWTHPHTWGALGVGLLLLTVFTLIESRVADPLVPIPILRRPTVAFGNLAGLIAFATETSLVFLLTLYLQEVLGYSALAAGMSFALLGLGTVLGGVLGPRVIGRLGARRAITAGFGVQGLATVPLAFVGQHPGWIWVLLIATFVGGVANLVTIVGFMVTATSGLPDREQGLSTGLATMSQQVGITLGIPVMSAIVTAWTDGVASPSVPVLLNGISGAIAVNAAICLAAAALLTRALKERPAVTGGASS